MFDSNFKLNEEIALIKFNKICRKSHDLRVHVSMNHFSLNTDILIKKTMLVTSVEMLRQ